MARLSRFADPASRFDVLLEALDKCIAERNMMERPRRVSSEILDCVASAFGVTVDDLTQQMRAAGLMRADESADWFVTRRGEHELRHIKAVPKKSKGAKQPRQLEGWSIGVTHHRDGSTAPLAAYLDDELRSELSCRFGLT